jgi:hypothetical protein
VKERPLVLIYANLDACQRFRHEHGISLRCGQARVDSLSLDLMGRRDFDYMLVDTALTPEWETEMNHRRCRHVIPSTRLRYRIYDWLTSRLQDLAERLQGGLFPARCRRIQVVK